MNQNMSGRQRCVGGLLAIMSLIALMQGSSSVKSVYAEELTLSYWQYNDAYNTFEKRQQALENLQDSDGDGLPDEVELALGGDFDIEDPSDGFSDEDHDDIPLSHEWLYGSNPLLVDSDGDGFDDYTEIFFATDPINELEFPILAWEEPNSSGDGSGNNSNVSEDGIAFEPNMPFAFRNSQFSYEGNLTISHIGGYDEVSDAFWYDYPSGFLGWKAAVGNKVEVWRPNYADFDEQEKHGTFVELLAHRWGETDKHYGIYQQLAIDETSFQNGSSACLVMWEQRGRVRSGNETEDDICNDYVAFFSDSVLNEAQITEKVQSLLNTSCHKKATPGEWTAEVAMTTVKAGEAAPYFYLVPIDSSKTCGCLIDNVRLVKADVLVDKERDHLIKTDGSDNTTADKFYRFWVNNGTHKSGFLFTWSSNNYSDKKINGIEDFENFSVLRIVLSGSDEDLRCASEYFIETPLKLVSSNEEQSKINLFYVENEENVFGFRYLKYGINKKKGKKKGSKKDSNGEQNTEDFLDKVKNNYRSYSDWQVSAPQTFFLFEGNGNMSEATASPNPNELLGLCLGDYKAQNLCHLQILPIQQMYGEHHLNDKTIREVPEFWENEENTCFWVHGWDTTSDASNEIASIVFKRLWWQLNKQKFIAVYWPTKTGMTTYNKSEEIAWSYGIKLANYINSFSGKRNVIAHSMGNIIVSSSLRGIEDKISVNDLIENNTNPDSYYNRIEQPFVPANISNYIMLNAAIPAECYDLNAERKWQVHEDEINRSVGNDLDCNVAKCGYREALVISPKRDLKIHNFYFEQDNALIALQYNQKIYRPDVGKDYIKSRYCEDEEQKMVLEKALFLGRNNDMAYISSDEIRAYFDPSNSCKSVGMTSVDNIHVVSNIKMEYPNTKNPEFSIRDHRIVDFAKLLKIALCGQNDHSGWRVYNFYQTRLIYENMKKAIDGDSVK